MTDRNEAEQSAEANEYEAESEARRAFLISVSKGVAKGAVTAPAVAMLLSAGTLPTKSAAASDSALRLRVRLPIC